MTTEQQLRAAVAEYDEEFAQEADYDYTSGCLRPLYRDDCGEWLITARRVSLLWGSHEQHADVGVSIAATMRAMDAAAKAFEAALKEIAK